jgi:hypothetical protein
MSVKRDYAAEAERIIRDGDERRRQAKVDYEVRIFHAVVAGKPLTIFGHRYIPDPDDPMRQP